MNATLKDYAENNMELIEQGNKIHECGDCGCKFRITSENEVKRAWEYVQEGDFLPRKRKVYYDSVKCPQCGNEIVIKWYW